MYLIDLVGYDSIDVLQTYKKCSELWLVASTTKAKAEHAFKNGRQNQVDML